MANKRKKVLPVEYGKLKPHTQNMVNKYSFDGENMMEFYFWFKQNGNNIYKTLFAELMVQGYSKLQARDIAYELLEIPPMFMIAYNKNKLKYKKMYEF